MFWNRRGALLAACAGLLCFASVARAQVEWKTTLNAEPVPFALSQQSVVNAPDGAIYSRAAASTSGNQETRIRVSRTSPAGAVQWTRWITGVTPSLNTVLFAHPDNSVSALYLQNGLCVANFLANGASRSQYCLAGDLYNAVAVAFAADGDLILSTGNYRTVRKVAPDGTTRWVAAPIGNAYIGIVVNGIDNAGNYFEVQGGQLRVWRASDGVQVADLPLVGSIGLPRDYLAPKSKSIVTARASGDIVLLRSLGDGAGNALVADVARYGKDGAVRWQKSFVFPGTAGYYDFVSVLPANNDGVYILRTPGDADGNSQIARVAANGDVLWQRHYDRARYMVPTNNGLVAIRTDVGAADGNSYLFAIADVDGSLGSPTIYTRNDPVAPNTWLAVTGGMIAAFQNIDGFPYTQYPTTLRATNVFLGGTPSNRWLSVAEAPADTAVSQSDCLMPKLGLSSPAAYWARTQPGNGNLPSDWTSINSSSGNKQAAAPAANISCGYPMTSDGGRTVVEYAGGERAKKLSSTGAMLWQTQSTTNPASSYANAPLQLVSPNNETTYAIGSLVGRVSPTGTIIFETEISRANPRYIAVDSTNNTLVVHSQNSDDVYVSKISSTGTLLWSTAINSPACYDYVTAARLTSADQMLVATQSCGEGRLFKISTNGTIAWQRVIGGTALKRFLRLAALQEDAAGNVYAGGCLSGLGEVQFAADAASLVASWTSAGIERWTNTADLITNASECVTSISTDATNNVFASSSSNNVAEKSPVLWSLTSAGVERWRHANVLAAPNAGSTETTITSDGKLIALGEALPNNLGGRTVTLRKVNVAAIGSTQKLKFLEVPAALVEYRAQFPVRVGLRTAADVAVNATAPVEVRLGLQSGTGTLDGSLLCTIAAGSSECTIGDTRYDMIEAGVTLSASADGFAAVVSPSVGFKKAATTATISVLSNAPYEAYSVVRLRASVQGPPARAGQYVGNINGPSANDYQSTQNCVSGVTTTALLANECDLLIRTTSFPVNASFSDGIGLYENSSAAPFTLSVTKVTPTLQVTADPNNTYITGDRVRFRVALMATANFNTSPFVDRAAISVSGGACSSTVAGGNFSNKYSGSYYICDVANALQGTLTINFDFSGDSDLLPAVRVSRTVTINAGAVFRSSSYIGSNNEISVCSLTSGVTCTIPQNSNEYAWQCVGPAGMSGSVFFVPRQGSNRYVFSKSPVQFSNVVGLVTFNENIQWNIDGSSCKLDVDGDGARLAMTDGILILRRMFGLTGAALTNGATHTCVPLTAAGIASNINLANYDIDGDGFTRPETDGLLLLRALIGFKGDSLIANAVSPTATRKTVLDINSYFSNACNLYLN